MLIDWAGGGTRALACPLCAGVAPKPVRLAVDSVLRDGRRLALVRCPDCGCAFYDDRTPAPYEVGFGGGALKFYVEQGAGIDVMLAPLFRVPRERVRRYLELGCGFGYALDFVGFAFGWRGRGLDPSAIARAGGEALGLDIVPGYLTEDTDFGADPYDLVFASELIEHVPDPHGFLRLAGRALGPGGALVLTTPNAAAVRPDTPSGLLLPILAPGHHVILFSRASLERVLRASGFAHVAIRESPHTLHAVASRGRYPLRPAAVVDGRLYRRYLAERARAVPADTPLGAGFAYRLFKACVNGRDFAAAGPVFEGLRAAYATRYGLDLATPDSIVPTPGMPADFERFAEAYPFNLTGVLFFRGMVELNEGGDEAAAPRYFRAAARAGVAIRTALRAIGADDGETESLVALARVHAVYAAARTDPGRAVSELEALAEPPGAGDPPADVWRIPPATLGSAREALRVRFVKAGAYGQAARLGRVSVRALARNALVAARRLVS